MNNRYAGKWLGTEDGFTLNIFDETPFRMTISFPDSGFYNYVPNCVYEKEGLFCFEINDDDNRGIFRLSPVGGDLEGSYSQYGKEKKVKYVKVSDVPEDLPFERRSPITYVPGTDIKRIDILKKYPDFDRRQEEGYPNEYVLGGDVPEVLEKYHYSDYVGTLTGKDDALAFRLLDFVCDNFGHNGRLGSRGKRIEDLVAFCEEHNNSVNCRGLAILLASLLRLNGIKARHITCMPYEEPFDDCHVVVDCLLPSGKQIMLDPSWRMFYKDKCGEYVSLPRLREILIAGDELFENPNASYNGNGAFDRDDYREYMTKNTFRFDHCTLNKEGVDGYAENYKYVELIPCGYPTENFSDERKKGFVYNDIEFWRI